MFKKLTQLFAVVILIFSLLTSCNNPDGQIYGTISEQTGWDMGKPVMTEYVIIQPTWGQAFYFAFKDGWYKLQFVLGMLLIVLSVGAVYAIAKNIFKVNLVGILISVILLAGGLAFIYTRPGTIKWNNDIKIEKQRYQEAKDNLPAFWDQLYNEKRIVGTSGE